MAERAGKALLVVDVQNDFCPGGALWVKNGDLVVEPLNRTIRFFEKNSWPIFFSRDWHPHETNHFKEFGGLWPVHCVATTWGAQFHPNLIVPSTARIISKGYTKDNHGYSPFDGVYIRSNDWPLSLNLLLSIGNVREIYIGGLATDYCVKAACLDARKLNYTVYLLTDACRAVNLKPGDGIRALNEMMNADVKITTTDEVILQSR